MANFQGFPAALCLSPLQGGRAYCNQLHMCMATAPLEGGPGARVSQRETLSLTVTLDHGHKEVAQPRQDNRLSLASLSLYINSFIKPYGLTITSVHLGNILA